LRTGHRSELCYAAIIDPVPRAVYLCRHPLRH
jgi:hypothetical protein